MSVFGSLTCFSMVIAAAMLNLLGLCAKCMSSYFFGANLDPWRFAYDSHFLSNRSSVSILPSVDVPYANILNGLA